MDWIKRGRRRLSKSPSPSGGRSPHSVAGPISVPAAGLGPCLPPCLGSPAGAQWRWLVRQKRALAGIGAIDACSPAPPYRAGATWQPHVHCVLLSGAGCVRVGLSEACMRARTCPSAPGWRARARRRRGRPTPPGRRAATLTRPTSHQGVAQEPISAWRRSCRCAQVDRGGHASGARSDSGPTSRRRHSRSGTSARAAAATGGRAGSW